MSEAGKIISYLSSTAFAEAARKGAAGEVQPFVTISRQAGAGGSTLAEALIARMGERKGETLFSGWRSWDRDICEAVLKDAKLSVSLESLKNETFRTSLADYLAQLLAEASPQSLVLKRVFETLRLVAGAGKAIIVGRAGSCVTRGLPMGIHIRLVGSEAAKIGRLMRRYQLDRRQAQKRMRELDEARRRLVKTYFNRDIEDPLLYHATWNTDSTPIDLIAQLTIDMIREAAGRGPTEMVAAVGAARTRLKI